jgi:hypothetical protein
MALAAHSPNRTWRVSCSWPVRSGGLGHEMADAAEVVGLVAWGVLELNGRNSNVTHATNGNDTAR